MLEFLKATDGTPVQEDEAVQNAAAARMVTDHEVERTRIEEATAIRIVTDPHPNDPSPSVSDREAALEKLEIRKGTQSSWYSPARVAAEAAHAKALAVEAVARMQAVKRLDAVRTEARKPLIQNFAAASDALLESREAVQKFDVQWEADRDSSLPMPERTTLEPIVSRGQIEGLKGILRAQGWL